jgi:L-lactate transport
MDLWAQPVFPFHGVALSALAAAIPLAVLLIIMGGLRKAGFVAATWGMVSALVLAAVVWRFPIKLALWSAGYGFVYGLWPIMWVVFTSLWLYNLSVDTGKFDLLRRWMAEHASGDARIQVILIAFCFGALLEGTSGFGAPVAIASFLLLGLGFSPRKAVTVCLIANTTPVAFGSLGIPIIALAGVTGLDLMKLSAMVGRQLPFLSFILPAYLILVVSGRKGLRETWPAALVSGGSFALTQYGVSNFWGPYAADILAALVSITAMISFLRVWHPAGVTLEAAAQATAQPIPDGTGNNPAPKPEQKLTTGEAVASWVPWVLLSVVMVVWSWLKLFQAGQVKIPLSGLDNKVFITLYNKPYAAVYLFQPLTAGTAALLATLLTALVFGIRPGTAMQAGLKTLRQLRSPALTVGLIVALAYLYNYSGMAYTLGAALASLGPFFPIVSSFLGWAACLLSGSDTASNLLFGNLQVVAANRIGVSPVLLAATNSSGAVAGKMISPQNLAVGVTTVGLVGKEGEIVRGTFGHSILLALALGLLAFAQAYWLKWMVP